jgi:hypothetical protein
VGETANERGGVEILHDGDAEFAHVGCAKPGNASIADAILRRVERF